MEKETILNKGPFLALPDPLSRPTTLTGQSVHRLFGIYLIHDPYSIIII
jgi:hypothetical protein